MTKYYYNNELVLTSKKNDYEYMVLNNVLNLGTRKSFHKDAASAIKAAAKSRREIQENIDYCINNNYPQDKVTYYQDLLEKCIVVSLEKVSA